MVASWHGEVSELRELHAAFRAYCFNCAARLDGTLCVPHTETLNEQRFLDGLLTYRRLRSHLLAEEWDTQ